MKIYLQTDCLIYDPQQFRGLLFYRYYHFDPLKIKMYKCDKCDQWG